MVLLNVPYIKQATDWSCSIACLEMLANYYGEQIDHVEIYNRLSKQLPGGQQHERCVFNDDLLKEAVRLGFDVGWTKINYTSVPDMMKTLRQHIDGGLPFIACQRSSMTSISGHSRLVIGYEEPAEGEKMPFVFHHDPANRGVPPGGAKRKWKADVFARMWSPNGTENVTGGVALFISKK